MRRYEGAQPQFVHRNILKQVLEENGGVKVVRGVGVRSVGSGLQGRSLQLSLSDGSQVEADVVIGVLILLIQVSQLCGSV